jgi:hypothetical protein
VIESLSGYGLVNDEKTEQRKPEDMRLVCDGVNADDPIFKSDSRLAADFGADKRGYLARSSPGIARDALSEAMLNRRVPITARSFFRGAVRVNHCTSSLDSIVEERSWSGSCEVSDWAHVAATSPNVCPDQNGGRASYSFEPTEDHIAIAWIIFDEAGKPP